MANQYLEGEERKYKPKTGQVHYLNLRIFLTPGGTNRGSPEQSTCVSNYMNKGSTCNADTE